MTRTGEIISFDHAQREKPPHVGQHVSVSLGVDVAGVLEVGDRVDQLSALVVGDPPQV